MMPPQRIGQEQEADTGQNETHAAFGQTYDRGGYQNPDDKLQGGQLVHLRHASEVDIHP